MEWQDKSVLIRKVPYKENSFILTFFTKNKGVKRSVVRASKKNKSSLQLGNIIDIEWKGRLDDHLGQVKILNCSNIYSRIFDNNIKIHTVLSICNLINDLFLENEPHQQFFLALLNFLYQLPSEEYLREYIKLELVLLSELGYGLDLNNCAGGGPNQDLAFISPKTGRAVSREIGNKYQNKLFKLPQSFKTDTNNIADISYSLKILRYFIQKNLYSLSNKKICFYRDNLEKLIKTQ